MAREPIKLRLVPRKEFLDSSNPREAFWRAVCRDIERDQEFILHEGKLCREFGWELRQSLVRHLSQPLVRLVQEIFFGPGRDLEHLLFRYFDGPRSDKERDQGQIFNAVARLIEQHQETLRESPAAIQAREKIALSSSVIFNVSITGYSSLNLDLSVGSINKVAEIFDNDFDSFRVFLDAFVPVAFAEVFQRDDADRVEFSVRIPESYRQDFSGEAPNTVPDNPSGTAGVAVPPPTAARERAEWLWKLANGSLLVPLLLALFVMYEGISTLRDIHRQQDETMKPMLEHQLKLLEEDRKRLFKDTSSSTPQPPTTSAVPAKP